MDIEDLFSTGGFWRSTSPTDVLLFLVVIAVAVGAVVTLRWWLERRQQRREALEFLEYSRRAGFSAEEYETAVDLVNEHGISPSLRLLVSQRQFDAVASARIEAALKDPALDGGTVKSRVQRLYAMRRKLAEAARNGPERELVLPSER